MIDGWVKISQGGISGTVVDIKLIAKYVLDSLSASCALIHNHPSGNIKPSDADLTITKKISNALKLIDCNVLDHIILTNDSYYSFADDNKL